ncbi:hypothetical protein VMCG_03677 [Cytospora schulzeri]|uniref:Uncharacterized protein n=1 Tax=Cytospora schulzeri TaxID=448051 RepID=A0A423WW60_9PEZI|nr:hypothetical protein VMCG_03677 [Valsa malicola]
MANVFPGTTMDVEKSRTMEADKKPDPNTILHPSSPTLSHNEDYRRMLALGFIHQIGQCRLALRYSMIGWTGTLDQDKIPNALLNAHSITQLNNRIDALERCLRPFLPRDPDGVAHTHPHPHPGQALDADQARRVADVRRRLLEIAPGAKSTRFIAPLLGEIESGAREARLLPPGDRGGWAWSWVHDDWFRWEDGEEKWVSARERELRVDYLM